MNTESPAPVFLGYRPKVRHPPDGLLEWLGTAGVVPVSDCLCGHPDPEWIQRWDFNRAGCYATVDAAWASVPEDRRADSEVLALWLLPARFVDGALRDVRMEDLFGDDLPPLPDADPDVRGEVLGWDVVAHHGAGTLGFGCSPLSCNGMAAHHPVNRWCLLDDLEAALGVAAAFAADPPEPGPYFPVRVERLPTPAG